MLAFLAYLILKVAPDIKSGIVPLDRRNRGRGRGAQKDRSGWANGPPSLSRSAHLADAPLARPLARLPARFVAHD